MLVDLLRRMRTAPVLKKINMAAGICVNILKTRIPIPDVFRLQKEMIHTSSVCFKVQSGKVRRTPKKNKPVTYQQSLVPADIGKKKAWSSWNTSTLEGGLRKAETTIDDMFIRKFITGTFPDLVLSEIVIKRQYNIIRIAFILLAKIPAEKFCFLIGYTEEMLSIWFQCIVKLEVQVVLKPQTVIFKYI